MPAQRTPTGQPGVGIRRCFCPRTAGTVPSFTPPKCRRHAAPRTSKKSMLRPSMYGGVLVFVRTRRAKGVSPSRPNRPCALGGSCDCAVNTLDRSGLSEGEGPDSKSSLSQGTCGWQHGISALRHACNGARMCGGRQMPEVCGQRGREAVAGAPGLLTNATETLLCSFGKRGRGAAACLSEPMFRRMRT